MMTKQYFLQTCSLLLMLLLYTACSHDETIGDNNTLPEGKFPLEIASVSLTAEVNEQPWGADAPQTRVTENADGTGSVWSEGEAFSVQIGGNGTPGTYVLDADGSINANKSKPAYWQNTSDGQSITAWYTSPSYTKDNAVTLSDQTNGLAYVLQTTTKANFNTEVQLNFSHKLAKVRVVPSGTQVGKVTQVEVYGHTFCTTAQGTVTGGGTQGWIKMKQQTYGDTKCWEANVVPGVEIKDFLLNGNVNCQLTQTVTPQAGHMHEVNINVKQKFSIVDSNGNPMDASNINTDVTITGVSDQPITITGTCNVTLKDVSLNVGSGNAISIMSGTPTIQVDGDNTVTSGSGTGIYVAEGSTVTITGNNRDDLLTARGGNGSPGIGGYAVESPSTYINCGNIHIANASVISYGSYSVLGKIAPGIGSVGNAGCGTITIDNAEVHAYGVNAYDTQFSPGIGCGYPSSGNPTSIPVVTISNGSEVHAHRGGGNADYIGWAGDIWNGTAANSTINLGGGTCKNSTIFCYTNDASTPDKTVVYDASGVGTGK